MSNNLTKYMETCTSKSSIWENVEVEAALSINSAGDDRILGTIVWPFSSAVILILFFLRKISKQNYYIFKSVCSLNVLANAYQFVLTLSLNILGIFFFLFGHPYILA